MREEKKRGKGAKETECRTEDEGSKKDEVGKMKERR